MSVYIIDKGNGIHQENNINTYIRTRVPPLNIIPLQQNKEYTENDAQCKQRTMYGQLHCRELLLSRSNLEEERTYKADSRRVIMPPGDL